MLINLRNALMAGKRLPYDAEVEYLETDGSAYINTGAKIYNDTSVVVVWYSNYSTSTASYFFGSDSSTDRFYFREYNGNASFSTGSWWQNTNINTVGTHTIEMSINGISVDGTASSRTGAAKTGDGNFCLFKVAAGNSPSGMRCYSCKIYQNDTLVRDFIPVRKGTVGYLYDRVSGKLFGNAGTGDFVLGPDVVPVEYIESHGTEWIDTGVVGNSSTKVEIKAQGTNTSALQVLLGGRDSNGPYSFAVWQRSTLDGAYGMRWDYLATNTGGGGGYVLDGNWNTSQPNLVVKDGANNYLNGVQLRANASNSFSCNFPLALLAMNTGGSKGNFFVGKMFMCKIFNNNTPTRDYKAIRIGSGSTLEGALMDVLTRRIYRNAGTGAFSYGNDLKYPIPAE